MTTITVARSAYEWLELVRQKGLISRGGTFVTVFNPVYQYLE
jgi:hypothetical protein